MRGRRFFTWLVSAALACAATAAAPLAGASIVAPAAPAAQQEVERITIEELKALLARDAVVVLDVRGGVDTKIKGAMHIPLDQLESRLGEIPRDREIVTYCS